MDFFSPRPDVATPRPQPTAVTTKAGAVKSGKGVSAASRPISPALERIFIRLASEYSTYPHHEEVWEINFQKLSRFVANTKNANPTAETCRDSALVRWCATQRESFRRRRISQQRFLRLHNLGFDFDAPRARIQRVPVAESSSDEDNDQPTNRYSAKRARSTRSSSRSRYESDDESEEDDKSRKQNQLRDDDSDTDSDGNSDHSDEDQERSRAADRHHIVWRFWYDKLVEFRNRYGYSSLNAFNCREEKKLAAWCRHQRINFRQRVFLKDRLALLLDIDFDFELSPTDPQGHLHRQVSEPPLEYQKWMRNFTKVKAYARTHSVTPPPKVNRKLADWCQAQRIAAANGTLSVTKRTKLNRMRFPFDEPPTNPSRDADSSSSTQKLSFTEIREMHEQRWNDRFEELKIFIQENGHPSPTNRTCRFDGLVSWCSHQRTTYHRGSLRTDRHQRLLSIGFQFTVPKNSMARQESQKNLNSKQVRHEQYWQAQYQMLEDFYNESGHANPNSSNCSNKTLLAWCANQRTAYYRRGLEPNRKSKLLALGFSFGRTVAEREAEIAAAAQRAAAGIQSDSDDSECPPLSSDSISLNPVPLLSDDGPALEENDDSPDESQSNNHPEDDVKDESQSDDDENDNDNDNEDVVEDDNNHDNNHDDDEDEDDGEEDDAAGKSSRSYVVPEGSPAAALKAMRQRLWMRYYLELKKFFQVHGHSTPTTDLCDSRLVAWCSNQRTAYRRKGLYPDRRALLEEIKFEFIR